MKSRLLDCLPFVGGMTASARPGLAQIIELLAFIDVLLPPGGFSVVVSGAGGTSDVAVVESFDLRSGTSAHIAPVGDTTPARVHTEKAPDTVAASNGRGTGAVEFARRCHSVLRCRRSREGVNCTDEEERT